MQNNKAPRNLKRLRPLIKYTAWRSFYQEQKPNKTISMINIYAILYYLFIISFKNAHQHILNQLTYRIQDKMANLIRNILQIVSSYIGNSEKQHIQKQRNQKELNHSKQSIDRQTLIQKILTYSINLKFKTDTAYLGISYADEILLKSNILSNFNINDVSLGILLISSKVNEITPPSLKQILKLGNRKQRNKLIQIEFEICKIMNYNLMVRETIFSKISNLLHKYNNGEDLMKAQQILGKLIAKPIWINYDIEILSLSIIHLVNPFILPQNGSYRDQLAKKIAKELNYQDKQNIKN